MYILAIYNINTKEEVDNMYLINNLMAKKTSKNEEIISELVEYIKEEKISNIEQLKALEDRIFTINGKILNDSQRIKYCFSIIENAYYDYDGLSSSEIKVLKNLKESITSDISDKEKIFNLIKINMVTNREIMFIKEAYEYILRGLL